MTAAVSGRPTCTAMTVPPPTWAASASPAPPSTSAPTPDPMGFVHFERSGSASVTRPLRVAPRRGRRGCGGWACRPAKTLALVVGAHGREGSDVMGRASSSARAGGWTGRSARLPQCAFVPSTGPMTGPNPTDPGKNGSKSPLITDRRGLPLSLGISGANIHDCQALEPLALGIPPIRSVRGPRGRRRAKLHGDKGYDDFLRQWLRGRGTIPRIARRGIDSSQRLGRHCWGVERTVSWLAGGRRLSVVGKTRACPLSPRRRG